jgi:hypothetical protein
MMRVITLATQWAKLAAQLKLHGWIGQYHLIAHLKKIAMVEVESCKQYGSELLGHAFNEYMMSLLNAAGLGKLF